MEHPRPGPEDVVSEEFGSLARRVVSECLDQVREDLAGSLAMNEAALTDRLLEGSHGLPVLEADLAAIVSKWIGETAKALEAALDRAEETGAVLLFDEADALFGTATADSAPA